MAQQTISYLKNKFETGAKPTQQDFADIFDSFVHTAALASLNNTTIDARITVYDTDQKQVSGSGNVATLGDVLDVFVGWDSAERLITVLDNIGGAPSWGDVSQRPERIDVVWDEVQVSVDTYLANNPPVPPNTSGQLLNPVSVAHQIGGINAAKKTVIRDIKFTFFQVQVYGSSLQSIACRPNVVVFGVEPRVKLSE